MHRKPLFQHLMLQEARRGFGAFYCAATTNDQQWMDTLVLAHVTFNQAFVIPRDLFPPAELGLGALVRQS
jgi:hypothetical protein